MVESLHTWEECLQRVRGVCRAAKEVIGARVRWHRGAAGHIRRQGRVREKGEDAAYARVQVRTRLNGNLRIQHTHECFVCLITHPPELCSSNGWAYVFKKCTEAFAGCQQSLTWQGGSLVRLFLFQVAGKLPLLLPIAKYNRKLVQGAQNACLLETRGAL